MAISTLQEAVTFANSAEGKALPNIGMYLQNVKDGLNLLPHYRQGSEMYNQIKTTLQQNFDNLSQAQSNPVAWVETQLGNASRWYAYYSYMGYKSSAAAQKTELQKATSYLTSQQVNPNEVNSIIYENANQGLASGKSDFARLHGSWDDKLFGVIDTAIIGGLTGGLGLSGVQSAALNASIQIANGADPEKAILAAAGGLAANQVPGFLQSVGATVDSPAVQTVINNVAKQVTGAAITGSDIGQAATAGLAGGAAADVATGLGAGTDVAKGIGQAAQTAASGGDTLSTLASGLSGYESSQQATTGQPISLNVLSSSLTPSSSKALGSFSLPYVGSTGGTQQQATPTQTTVTPGSQALAQALRIGDVGAPIFGGDKEGGKKSGWNVESLRYMGNSEA
jgi:hypothetical protein